MCCQTFPLALGTGSGDFLWDRWGGITVGVQRARVQSLSPDKCWRMLHVAVASRKSQFASRMPFAVFRLPSKVAMQTQARCRQQRTRRRRRRRARATYFLIRSDNIRRLPSPIASNYVRSIGSQLSSHTRHGRSEMRSFGYSTAQSSPSTAAKKPAAGRPGTPVRSHALLLHCACPALRILCHGSRGSDGGQSHC
jgi:hypothetical protein